MDRSERLYRIDALLHEHTVVPWAEPLRVLWRPIALGWSRSRGQHVIKPDAGQIQVLRLWAG